MTQCNLFTTLDASNVFSLLSTPFPASSLSLATFTFPLTNSSTLPFALANTSSFIGDFAITATGLGASGTVEIVGSDAPEQVASGTEGMLQVDVVVRYSGDLDLDHIMRVCRTSRSDGSMGVGIYVSLSFPDCI